MVVTSTVELIGDRRYVTPSVITGVISTLLIPHASVSMLSVLRQVDLSMLTGSVGSIVPRNLDTITDASGVAFDDGQGGAFHIY